MLAFSTCWNAHRHQDGEALVNEVLMLGFEWVELSYGMRAELLPGFREAWKQGRIRVSGIHHFCPSPPEESLDSPDSVELTAERPADRACAIERAKGSIDLTVEFEAAYLILHLGRIPLNPGSRALEEALTEGKLNDRDYVQRKIALVKAREEKAPVYWERACAGLEQLLSYAEERGIHLAIEARRRYEEVPSERELDALFATYQTSSLGYWHDFGHVEAKAALGLLDHAEQIERRKDRWTGCHVHDFVWPAEDHSVPFQGRVDFPGLVPQLSPELPFVWEIRPRRKTQDIKDALQRWLQAFPETATLSPLS